LAACNNTNDHDIITCHSFYLHTVFCQNIKENQLSFTAESKVTSISGDLLGVVTAIGLIRRQIMDGHTIGKVAKQVGMGNENFRLIVRN